MTPDDPWPIDWEQRPAADLCRHQWETHTTPRGAHGKPERVARCSICHTPRCGHSNDPNPCLERRHHDSLHNLRRRCVRPARRSAVVTPDDPAALLSDTELAAIQVRALNHDSSQPVADRIVLLAHIDALTAEHEAFVASSAAHYLGRLDAIKALTAERDALQARLDAARAGITAEIVLWRLSAFDAGSVIHGLEIAQAILAKPDAARVVGES